MFRPYLKKNLSGSLIMSVGMHTIFLKELGNREFFPYTYKNLTTFIYD